MLTNSTKQKDDYEKMPYEWKYTRQMCELNDVCCVNIKKCQIKIDVFQIILKKNDEC